MLQVSKMSIFKRFLFFWLLLLSYNNVYSAQFCSDQYYIEAALPNGAKWDMCWEHRNREGIVFHHVFYTPKNGSREEILYSAAIAQIHVPYDDNGARYHDISDFGIGGSFLMNITSQECLNGTLKQFSGKNVICRQIESRHAAHYTSSEKLHGDALSLFSVSKVGAYHYIPMWKFFDDGTIQPSMGATGALQRFSGGLTDHGWPVNSNRTGIAHLHNFFWRLDFDLTSSGNNDYVEELNFPLVSGKREKSITKFSSEAARSVNPSTLRSWRIVDGNVKNSNGHVRSYEFELIETGHKDVGPNHEPFTHNDFFVTKANNCEKFASHNPTINGCGKNLAEFANGEDVSGNDIIVWVGLSFYHMPRVEDAPHMDSHWNHFNIIPRDWHAKNPLGTGTGTGNTAPSVTSPGNQSNSPSDVVNLAVVASDPESDTLVYSAASLPPGLSINSSTGVISGTISASASGVYPATVTVSDGQLDNSASFNWTISVGNVNVAPVITSPGNQTNMVGQTINLQINATDANNDTLTYTATGLGSDLAINGSTGVITGTISSAAIGTHSITVAVSDSQLENSTTFNWTISTSNTNVAPVIAAPENQTNIVGNSINLQILATDANNDTLSYAATGLPSGLVINNTTGLISGNLGTGTEGDYTVNITVSDGEFSATTSLTWKVNAAGTGGNTIQIDGNDADWSQITSYTDTLNENLSPVDIETISITGDDDKVYIAYHDRQAINPDISWAWQIVIDTDFQSNTGLKYFDMGGDYLLVGKDLYKYNGDGTSWNWTELGPVEVAVNGKFAEFAINRNIIGQSNKMKMTFYGANTYAGGTTNDFFFVNINNVNGSGGGGGSNDGITIDGNSNDWDSSQAIIDGPEPDTFPVDFQSVWFKQNSEQAYFAYNNRINIDANKFWAWVVLIDSDKKLSTGINFYNQAGGDFLLLGKSLYKYAGNGQNWKWTFVRDVSSAINGKFAEIAIDKSDLNNSNDYKLIYYGSNTYAGGVTDDRVIVTQ
ncbi:MAG: putative Ig domain-containing protein [Methylococcales bacterium]|nr:putative Ig domain-containing protein [Methylococcales bacterium]